MPRVLVILLAALDAVLAAAVGVALALAPLALAWTLAPSPDWAALWPVAGTVWQFGHGTPLHVRLPEEYVAAAGIDPAGADFALSLQPLAFAVLTIVLGVRSGRRAAAAGGWVTGVGSGAVVFAALAAAVAATAVVPILDVEPWQAILLPSAWYLSGLALGAITGAWEHGDDGPLDALRRRLVAVPGGWGRMPELIARGAALALAALAAAAALLFVIALALGAGRVVALFQTGNVDLGGVVMVSLGQAAYLPVVLGWSLAFLAGPGFALGAGTAVSAAGTTLGVLPGIPLLGAVPQTSSPWLLALTLLPVAAGALAGLGVRGRLRPAGETAGDAPSPLLPLTLAAGIAIVTAAAAALIAFLSSGSMGPGRLAVAGPAPGAVALAIGVEVALGAGIALLAPRRAAIAPPID
jgi:hypothetical protein